MIRSLQIKNFRGLSAIDLPNLARTNILGGLNAVGKSSVIEAIFTLADRRDFLFMGRLASFRNMPFAFENEINNIFFEADLTKDVVIEARTDGGLQRLSVSYGQIATPPRSMPFANGAPNSNVTTVPSKGLTIKFFENNRMSDLSYIFVSGPQVAGWIQHQSGAQPPPTTILTPVTRYNQIEAANRYSDLVKQGLKASIVQNMRSLIPSIDDIEILNISGQSIIHVSVGFGKFIPLSTVGDGAFLLLIIICAMMASKNGLILLDEFDTAIHYSKLSTLWSIVCELADIHHCQVFAATHSLECIKAAAEAFARSGKSDAMRYIRIDRAPSGLKATDYNAGQVLESTSADWELR